jgi:hypothetical protein
MRRRAAENGAQRVSKPMIEKTTIAERILTIEACLIVFALIARPIFGLLSG